MKRTILTTLVLLAAMPAGAGAGGGPPGVLVDSAGRNLTVRAPLGYDSRIAILDRDGNCGEGRATICISDETRAYSFNRRCEQVDATRVECAAPVHYLHVDTTDGDDFVRANSPKADAVGEWKKRVFLDQGTDAAVMRGRGWIRGGGGNDDLVGRRGNQRLDGGRGRDRIAGWAGRGDSCDGGNGADSGGRGCETIVSIERGGGEI
jgi:Ca2+-binding RTX toxin-like protein